MKRTRGDLLALLAFALVEAAPLAAQAIRGTVVLPDSMPVSGVIVVVSDEHGSTVGRVLTNARGEFAVRLSSPGRVGVRLLRIGYRPTRGPSFDLAAGATEAVRLVLGSEAVTLSAVNVRVRETCRVGADTGLMVAHVWEEARKAMLSTQLNADSTPLFAEWIEYDRSLDSTARMVRDQRVRTSRTPTTHAFRSRPAAVLAEQGYVVSDSGVTMFYAPDAEVLLSEIFAAGHCFRLEEPSADSAHLIGVSFAPTRDRRAAREIEGTFWLDRRSAELRTLDFRYTNLPPQARSVAAGGQVEFLRLGDGEWLVSRWRLRMPQFATRRMSTIGRRVDVSGTQLVLRGVQETGGEVTSLTRRDSVLFVLIGAEIVVQVVERDTLVRASRSILTLDGTDYTGTATASGRIELSPVLPGRYHARIRTPLMDSLGMPAVEQDLEARADSHVDTLQLPVARVIVEVDVRDVSGAPLRETTLDVRSANGGPTRTAVTAANGRASLRDLPQGATSLQARRIGYQPGTIEITIQPGRNDVPIVLSQVAAPELDTVRVAAHRVAVARLQDFETRRLKKQATASITREDILKRNPAETWHMLTNVPSLLIADNGNAVVARSTRSKMANFSGLPCPMLVAVDGVVLKPTPGATSFDLRQLPRPDEIHGIEVFAGAASIPLQYGGEGDGKWCGLIAIWTR
jgi:Carboxypeptidase regulatory-like domain/TonB-dependent Receptor Plug Domain